MRNSGLALFWSVVLVLTACAAIIIYKLVTWPPCSTLPGTLPTNSTICVIDGGSVAGLAAAVLGVAATVLAILGTFAVAAWWSALDSKVDKRVVKLFNKQMEKVKKEVDSLINAQKQRIDVQVAQLQKMDGQVARFQNAFHQLDVQVNNLRTSMGDVQKVNQTIADGHKAVLYLLIGSQLVDQGKLDTVIDIYEKVKQIQPLDPQVNYILGQMYSKIRAYDKAIACLEIAVKQDQDFALAHFELGLAYRQLANTKYNNPQDKQLWDQDYEKALKHMEQAVKLLPHDDVIAVTLGGTYRRTKDYDNAIRCFQDALKLNATSSYALGNLACIAWHEGDLPLALATFEKTDEAATERILARSSYEPHWDYYDRAMARLALKREEEAMEDYRTALNLTQNVAHLESVLSGISFLLEVKDTYPIDGLDKVLAMVRDEKTKMEEQQRKKKVVPNMLI
jgi:tetratricopeptide (TPR) repeat protein